MRRLLTPLLLVLAVATLPVLLEGRRQTTAPVSNAPISYRVTFPAPEHHWMQVEASFSKLPSKPLDVHMSRSSPGRYAVAEFAKNVFSVEAYNSKGQTLEVTRPDADVWRVTGHDGTVRIVYKIFGDYANGTFFGVDTTHAHLNMPAAFMWAVGHDDDAMSIAFVPPEGSKWKVATQLYPTRDPNTFTSPNLQYLMDSPVELSDFLTSTFAIRNADGTSSSFRLVVHGDGSQADVDELTKLVERLVREEMTVFGEFPKYEPGNYTFLLDYVAWGAGDGMEHRNSTSISNPGLSIKTPQGRQAALGTIAHEFFHNWNMERIRSAGIEPFDFTRENASCCLWLGEGFTQYYGPLLITRAGLGAGQRGNGPAAILNNAVQVINTPGRAVHSPVQMSEYAPFADGSGTFVDATDSSRTFLSYYTYGAGIALALDFSLREMSGGKLSLDDYMHLLWITHGKPGGPQPGIVGKPYTLANLREHLATLTGNRKFADDFFSKYVEGREAPDYSHLMALAGYTLRMANPGKAWAGNVAMNETGEGLEIGTGGRGRGRQLVPFDTPLYEAGVDSGDIIRSIDGQRATMAAWNAVLSKRPGDQVTLVIVRRDGASVTKRLTLRPDPSAQQIVPNEELPGGSLSEAQKAFRSPWLSSKSSQ
jgi:predicted metalloprotease with PDZ domain